MIGRYSNLNPPKKKKEKYEMTLFYFFFFFVFSQSLEFTGDFFLLEK